MKHRPIIYDLETYPNCFLAGFMDTSGKWWVYEISDRMNQCVELREFLYTLEFSKMTMVGFNNLGFDYPIIHTFMKMCVSSPDVLYKKAQSIIDCQDNEGRWSHQVYPSDRIIPQIDLYKIHHFDNNSRRTSLKALEFAMRMPNIQELPFPPGTILTHEEMDMLKGRYLENDLTATLNFYNQTTKMIEFREELTGKYGRDFINHNDTKIGKDYFIMELEKAGVPLYEYDAGGRTPRQTNRPQIVLNQAILPWIQFENSEFNRVLSWLKDQVVTETKGVFKDLIASVDGFDFVFGLGGIHGSVESEVVESDQDYIIIDLDVASYYPNLSIVNRLYPAHLGEVFCDIYQDVYEQRKLHPKKEFPTINAMLKLALNGVYGDSNNPFSVFYDPLYTMSITLNGQLLLCKLAERLMRIPNLRLLSVNTDGLTVKCPRSATFVLNMITSEWEKLTGLQLESALYSRMFIRDVNNYIAEYDDGKVKRKGAYCYETPLDNPDTGEVTWNKNFSSLVVPKIAEKILINGGNIMDELRQHRDFMDFMCLVKVPKSSRLVINHDTFVGDGDYSLQNLTRYYISTTGGELIKLMPPTGAMIKQGKVNTRRISVNKGWKVCVCSNIEGAVEPINYDYYVNEIEKLVMGLK